MIAFAMATGVGALLGALAPTAGLALLLAVACTTPSLPWQLGLANLSWPIALAAGLAIGSLISRTAQPRTASGPPPTIPTLVGALLVLPMAMAAVADLPLSATPEESALFAAQAAGFNPPGAAGLLQHGSLRILALAIGLLTVAAARSRASHGRLALAAGAAAVMSIGGPWVQRWLLDVNVRPDWGRRGAEGAAGFFQDPHAAACALAMSAAAGAALTGAGHRRVGLLMLGSSLATLPLTRSRAAVVVAVVAVAFAAVVAVAGRRRNGSLWSRRVAAVTITGILAITVLQVGLAASGGRAADLAARVATRASEVGPLAMLDTSWRVRSDDSASTSVLQRFWHWKKAVDSLVAAPLWGIGPGQIQRLQGPVRFAGAEVNPVFLRDNSHQYYLQSAAELGLPAGFAWIVLLLGSWALVVQRAVGTGDVARQALASALLVPLLLSLVEHPLLLPELLLGSAVLAGLGLARSEA